MITAPPEPSLPALTDYERLIRLEELVETLQTRIDELEQSLLEIKQLESKLDEVHESLQIEIAMDRKRITKLEHDESVSAKTAARHLDYLYEAMISNGLKQVTFRRASMLIGISYSHACRLSAMIEDDPRFKLVKDQHHKQRWLIRLMQ